MCQVVAHLLADIRQQAVRIAALNAHVLELSQLRSSPWSDPPYEKRTVRSDSQGQPGATPGHLGYHRLLLASTDVIEDEEATLFTMEGRQQTGARSNLFVLAVGSFVWPISQHSWPESPSRGFLARQPLRHDGSL